MQATNQPPTTQDRARRGLEKVSTGIERAQHPVCMVAEQRRIEDGCRHSDAINLLYYGAPNKNKDSTTCAQTGTESSPFQVPKRGFNSFLVHSLPGLLLDAGCLPLFSLPFSPHPACVTVIRGYGAGRVLPSLFYHPMLASPDGLII